MKFLFLILTIVPVSLSAQKEIGGQFVYAGVNHSPNTVNQVSPTIGFYHVDKRNNLNDFQLNRMSYRKTFGTNSTDLNFSYHKVISLNKRSTSKFYLGLGLGAQLYYDRHMRKPLTASSFLTMNSKTGAVLSVKPVVNYAFSERLFLGLSANVGLVDQSVAYSRYENPVLPLDQQRIVQASTGLLDWNHLNFALTMGFKIK